MFRRIFYSLLVMGVEILVGVWLVIVFERKLIGVALMAGLSGAWVLCADPGILRTAGETEHDHVAIGFKRA